MVGRPDHGQSRQHQERIESASTNPFERGIELVRPVHADRLDGDSECLGCRLDNAKQRGHRDVVRVPQDDHARHCRNRLLQYLELLCGDGLRCRAHSGDVSPRPSETGHQPLSDGIGREHEHDWDRRCRLLGRELRRDGLRENDISRQGDEFGRHGGQSVDNVFGDPELDDDVASLDVAEGRQLLPEGGAQGLH